MLPSCPEKSCPSRYSIFTGVLRCSQRPMIWIYTHTQTRTACGCRRMEDREQGHNDITMTPQGDWCMAEREERVPSFDDADRAYQCNNRPASLTHSLSRAKTVTAILFHARPPGTRVAQDASCLGCAYQTNAYVSVVSFDGYSMLGRPLLICSDEADEFLGHDGENEGRKGGRRGTYYITYYLYTAVLL